jgi:hypothetical protein
LDLRDSVKRSTPYENQNSHHNVSPRFPLRLASALVALVAVLQSCLWVLGGLILTGSIAQAEIKAGDILVLDQAPIGHGALFVVNPATGERTILSDFSNPAQGSLGQAPTGVAVGAEGQIFVSDLFAGTGFSGALFGVDPDTGNRTLLSDFGQGAIQGNLYYGLAVDAKGRVIADLQRFEPPAFQLDAALVRVDPKTDKRVIVSDLNQSGPGADSLWQLHQ